MIMPMKTTGHDPSPPAGLDLTRLPGALDEQRFKHLDRSGQRKMLAYLHFRLEVDAPGHGRATLGSATAGTIALLVATLAIFMQLSGPDLVTIAIVLVTAVLLAATALIYGMFRGPRVDRRRGFTRAWLKTLEKLPQESESMPT